MGEYLAPGVYVEELPTNKPIVALSFDDGPDPRYTPQVLDMLDHFRARATFFVVGLNALALTDHDSLGGAVRFWNAGRKAGLPAILGADFTLEGGDHLLHRGPDAAGRDESDLGCAGAAGAPHDQRDHG